MKIKLFTFIALLLITAACVFGQTKPKTLAAVKPTAQEIKSSPAYAEILLRKTDLEAELEDLLVEYTEDYPKVKETRFSLSLIQKESERLLASNLDASRLTLALGKLMVRKTELETDLWNLRVKFSDEHPEVKRARKKVDVFEKAIKEILP